MHDTPHSIHDIAASDHDVTEGRLAPLVEELAGADPADAPDVADQIAERLEAGLNGAGDDVTASA